MNENPKRVVFLEAVQDYGGARISTVELAERLSVKHDVTMLDFYGSCNAFLADTTRRNIKLEIIDKREVPFIINTSKSFIFKLINYFLFLPHWYKMRRETIKRIALINPDFIIINNFKVLSALMFFPNKKFKTLFFARGWFIPSQISKIQNIMLKKWVDKYLCVSQATKNALFAGGLTSLENLYVVPNAINETKLSKEKADITKGANTTLILHAGGFLKDKGQLVSLETAKVLKKNGVNFKMLLVGIIYKDSESKPFYHQVKEIITKYHLENHVEIILNKPNVISYFNACDILIHPSETEGLPRVIMEAMILRKPTIANAVGGVTDYILNGYTGFLPHHNSHKDYAKYIEALIENKDLYNQISNNAYDLVNKTYTEQNQLDCLFRVFES